LLEKYRRFFQGAVDRLVEDIPAVCEGDQILPVHVQGEDGAGLRLCLGQDGHGHTVKQSLDRLHKFSQGKSLSWFKF
jgi:hypothetical protein